MNVEEASPILQAPSGSWHELLRVLPIAQEHPHRPIKYLLCPTYAH